MGRYALRPARCQTIRDQTGIVTVTGASATLLYHVLVALVFSYPIRFHCPVKAKNPTDELASMRLSRFFLPILRETSKEAEVVSHRLMLRAGMLRQEAAGIYAFLPLGLRVLKKINRIVREEQNRAGAIELLMPTIQPADLWRESGRYDDYGREMLRIKDRHDRDMLYGPTNEEMITSIFRAYVRSYKDLPLNLYHIQWKFRDEVRPRFGLMRGREFLMKDAYSFDVDQAGSRHSYNKMFVAYLRTFARMGLKSIPMVAETGPIGGNLSHEFIILAHTGESEVFCHRDYLDFPVPSEEIDFDDVAGLQSIVDKWTSLYAATSEKHDPAAFAQIPTEKRVSARGIEVGHIFYFGTKYSEPMKAVVSGPDGVERPVHMGSYGIGPSRLVAAIIEAFHDDAGIKWPEVVAPFHVMILNLKQGDAAIDAACETLYRDLAAKGIDVLYHDLDERPGSKFATADLIGVPWQVIVGPKGLAAGAFEVKRRADGSRENLSPTATIDLLSR
jgi:prolyl-tRNA synthetase